MNPGSDDDERSWPDGLGARSSGQPDYARPDDATSVPYHPGPPHNGDPRVSAPPGPFDGQQRPVDGQQQPFYGRQQPQPAQQPPILAAPTPGPAPSGGSKLGLIIGGAAVLLIAVTVLASVAIVRSGRDQTAGVQSPKIATPDAAVRSYLEAVAAGDAERALSLVAAPLPDSELLNGEVLARSGKIDPMTAIGVRPAESGKVRASFRIGDTDVSATFATLDAQGSRKLISPFTRVSLPPAAKALPLTVNGVEVEPDESYAVFPGTYEIATTVDFLDFGDSGTFTAEGPADYPRVDLKPELSKSAQSDFRQKVTAAVGKCVASSKLDGGCGLSLPTRTDDGYKLKEGTVKRSLRPTGRAELRHLDIEPDSSNYLVATVDTFDVELKTTFDATKGGRTYTGVSLLIGGGVSFSKPSIDMSTKKLTVEWD